MRTTSTSSAPLDQPTIDKLDAKWKELNNLKLINFMKAAPQLRNRLFRDIHMKVARMLPVDKVKSAEDNRLISEPEKRELGSPTSDGARLILGVGAQGEPQDHGLPRVLDCSEGPDAGLRLLRVSPGGGCSRRL